MFRTLCIFCFLQNLHMTLSSKPTIREEPEPPLPQNCSAAVVVQSPFISVYSIRLPNSTHPPFNVYCESKGHDQPWTVIYRKEHSKIKFSNRSRFEYENGFGSMTGDFFIGQKKIVALTLTGRHEMDITEKYQQSTIHSVRYNDFRVRWNGNVFEVMSLGDKMHEEMKKVLLNLFQPEWDGFQDDKLRFQIMIRPLVVTKKPKNSKVRRKVSAGEDDTDEDSDKDSYENSDDSSEEKKYKRSRAKREVSSSSDDSDKSSVESTGKDSDEDSDYEEHKRSRLKRQASAGADDSENDSDEYSYNDSNEGENSDSDASSE